MPILFIYGTLKRGGSNHHHLAQQIYLGDARTVAGYCLYSLGAFPGMVREPGAKTEVIGEIWRVDDATLAALDVLEGVAEKLYAREPVALQAPFEGMQVLTYIYLRPVDSARRLGSKWTE